MAMPPLKVRLGDLVKILKQFGFNIFQSLQSHRYALCFMSPFKIT